MAKSRHPRYGSMQYWPRSRAKRIYSRIRSVPDLKETKILDFAGYKAGMTHIILKDNRKTSQTKDQDISCPVTIIECPPLKAFSLLLYKKTSYGLKISGQVFADNLDKELARKLKLPKSKNQETKLKEIKDFDDIRLLCHTQPKLTGIGKKKPEVFEIHISGKKEDKLDFAKEKLGKEISVEEIFKEGQLIDVHSVTKGKGFQGPVKRFGISLRSHKSEKTKRGPGSLGAWKAQGHIMYRVAHAGQTGFQARTEYNKHLLKIGKNPAEIKIKGGLVRYGFVKNPFLLIKGSISGSKKRLIRFNHAIRPAKRFSQDSPEINYISLK